MLTEITLPESFPATESDPAIEGFLSDAEARIEAFTRRRSPPIHNFVACDFRVVSDSLQWIISQSLLTGETMCEWGSGFGVVAMLAAWHGLDAVGIEVEPDLIQQADSLASDYELDVHFGQGSFIPDEASALVQSFSDIAHIDVDSRSAYDDLDFEPADFDLFFAFPWPGEQECWESIFDHVASSGAMLLTYQGINDMQLLRKQ